MMRIRSRLFHTFFLCAAALAIGACGGGGGGSTPFNPPTATTPPPPPPPPPPPMNFDTAEFQNQPSLAQINVLPAYDDGAQGQNVIVSIIDSGIDVDDPEFAGRIHPQSADLVITSVVGAGDARSGGPDLQDSDDHGTPIASIIGAARDTVGVHGVAPEVELLIFRADDESPDEDILFGAAISEGVDRSATIGAGVINMSFGSDEAGARADFEGLLSFTKANDIVTVIAAGNDSEADPDPSALGALDVAGDPATIISGAVDGASNIASFSNRAGVAADIYLSAPGVGIRTTFVGAAPGQTRSFSGTSASTPQIAGAAALVRSLWPALTATEVVDILLTTATDLGAPGTDPIYGRGLLNVGAAVSPIGGVVTSSISGASVDPNTLGGALSGVYGAELSSLGEIVVLDSYDRDFRLSLGETVAHSAPASLDLERRYSPFDNHRYARLSLGGNFAMRMRLTSRDQSSYSLINNQMTFDAGLDRSAHFADHTLGLAMTGAIGDTAFAAAQGFSPAAVDRLALRSRNTPFLSDGAFADAFLPQSANALSAISAFPLSSKITMDVLLSRGQNIDALDPNVDPFFNNDAGAADQTSIFVLRSGLTFDLGEARLRLEQGMRRETGGVFNARFDDNASASTAYAAIEGVWSPASLWQVQGRIAAGLTRTSETFGFDDLAAGTPQLTTTQFSVALHRQKLFGNSDALWLGVSQPLQIEAGALELMLPTGFDPFTEEFTYTATSASLAADGRRLDYEAGYRLFSGPLGAVDVNLIHQTFGGYDAPAETTALVRGQFQF